MQIKFSKRFEFEFLAIYKFIAVDSVSNADDFKNELSLKINNIVFMPYMYRKSIKSDDESVRDLIFKKYVIPYKIKKTEILILGIFNQNKWKAKF